MKKIAFTLLALVFTLGFTGCSDDDDLDLSIQPDPDGLTITSSLSAEYILTPATGSNIAERFVWTPVDFDLPTDVTYEVQGATSTAFDTIVSLSATGDTNASVTVDQLLDLADDAALDNDPETTTVDADGNPVANNTGVLYIRIQAYAGNGNANTVEQFSEIQMLNVVLPENAGGEEETSLPQLFLVGDATAVGYNNNANNPVAIRNPENENEFSYTGRFLAGETGFKFIEMKGQWQPQWGIVDGVATVNDGSGDDPQPFTVPAEGYYTVTLNTEEPAYTIEAYDAAGAATYESIGLIGTARTEGGFDAPDTDMTQSDFDPHLWYVESIELVDGDAKFRANDAWDVNWGATTSYSGYGTIDGSNIPVTAGTYEIWFNDLTGDYNFVPLAQ